MENSIQIELISGDALSIATDVLALKYAQGNYGLDEIVSNFLIDAGTDRHKLSPKPDGFRIVRSANGIRSAKVLFMGVVPLYDFSYRQIRDFSRRVLSALAGNEPSTKSIVLTLHGANYGLDEVEAFSAEIAGLIDGIQSLDFPKELQKITIVERNTGRANRLNALLDNLIPQGFISPSKISLNVDSKDSADKLRSVGYDSDSKAHIFVAMPFKAEMDDIYHYGIQGAVNSAGYLCERADLSTFTGDVMQWVKDRISSARLVVADLTEANPNVYLEVGYAWGQNIPVVLLVNDTEDLKFDVKGQRCLKYGRIKDLEGVLAMELATLKSNGSI